MYQLNINRIFYTVLKNFVRNGMAVNHDKS